MHVPFSLYFWIGWTAQKTLWFQQANSSKIYLQSIYVTTKQKADNCNSFQVIVPRDTYRTSAVTIIVVTIFIATFQNYRIIFLSRYFLCVRNDIFARHLRYANMIDSPPVYSSFSTLQSRFNHVPRTTWRVIAARRPWLSSVSVPWKTPQLPLK